MTYVLVLKAGEKIGFAAAPGSLDMEDGSFMLSYILLSTFDHKDKFDLVDPSTGYVVLKDTVMCSAGKNYKVPGDDGSERVMLEDITCAAKCVTVTYA